MMKNRKNKKMTEAQKKHLRKQSQQRNKRAEKETEKLQREIEKMQSKGLQIVNSDSTKELERIRLSQLPKQPKQETNTKEYRKQRAKRKY